MDKTCNFNLGTLNSKAKTGFFFEQSSGPKIKWTALEREKISIKVATNSNKVVVVSSKLHFFRVLPYCEYVK